MQGRGLASVDADRAEREVQAMAIDIEAIARAGEQAFNDHDAEAVRQTYADQAVLHGPGGLTVTGGDACLAWTTNWWKGFPDSRVEIHEHLVSGNTITMIGTFHGTHTAPFPTPMGDIAPTQKSVAGEFVQIFHVDDEGKVADERIAFDRLDLLEQLGLMPTPAGAAAG